ncbi:MAG: right-handed parallel beta-helix repeat-containing protein [Euryarchaeota archaeon]|nr:right-handed parallel beta-helix repeat-containing protein [Euryarchaeota archaeon]
MEKYPLIGKGLAVGIILLFVGAGIIPATAQDIEKSSLPTSSGQWLYVGGSGPGNYTRIQDAINVSHNGDTVFVFHGTYYEHIVINKAIYLIGENVNTTTIIDNYSQESAAISIQYGNVTVMDFTINGQSTYSAIGLVSGWTTIKGNNILSLVGMVVWSYNNSILYNNITGYGLPGAGIGCGIDEILSYNRIEHNSIFSTISTGISVWGNSNVINSNLIVANGLSDIYGSKNVLSNNTFQNSGLRFYNPSENIVTNNTVNGKPLVFLDNMSNKVIDYDTAQVILVRCNNVTITNQNFSHSPDSIQVLNSTNCYIINNTISYCSSGGITIYYSDTIMVMDNTINSSWINIGWWNSGYNNNIIVSRNTFTSDALGGYGINIENTYNCTLSYNNLVNTYIGLAYYCRNCKIWYNNFITSSYIDIYVAFFSHTTLKGNYWERPRLFPKLILGTLWKEGEDYPKLLLPWFFIDWQPAQEPYNIPR